MILSASWRSLVTFLSSGNSNAFELKPNCKINPRSMDNSMKCLPVNPSITVLTKYNI